MSNFREKYKPQIFAITKAAFLIWTIVLAGALDQWKASVVGTHNTLLAYSIFWGLLTGVAGLFAVFWNAKNIDEIGFVLDILQSIVIIPIFLLYILLIVVLAGLSPKLSIGTTIILTAIPVITGTSIAWKNTVNRSGIGVKLLDAFRSR